MTRYLGRHGERGLDGLIRYDSLKHFALLRHPNVNARDSLGELLARHLAESAFHG